MATLDFLASGSAPSAAGQTLVSTSSSGGRGTAAWAVSAGGQIYNQNTSVQSLTMVAGTSVYVAGSGLTVPSTVVTGPVVGSKLKWRIVLSKNAAGTGNWLFQFKAGTGGVIGDATIATLTLTQTAAIDFAVVDAAATFTVVGVSATVFWTLTSVHNAAAGAGFGFANAIGSVSSGTSSTFDSITSAMIYGLAVQSGTGTPTLTITEVDAIGRVII